MNDKLKNLIVGGLAIFGLVTIISSATSNPTIVHEGSNTPESHVWDAITTEVGTHGYTYVYNKQTGEAIVLGRSHSGIGKKVKVQ
ncbi:MAG: hypothetical protein ACJ0QO_04310 [Parvicellaceae bacterium]